MSVLHALGDIEFPSCDNEFVVVFVKKGVNLMNGGECVGFSCKADEMMVKLADLTKGCFDAAQYRIDGWII